MFLNMGLKRFCNKVRTGAYGRTQYGRATIISVCLSVLEAVVNTEK